MEEVAALDLANACARVIAAFKKFDANGDGVISRDELGFFFRKISPDHFGDDELEMLLKEADKNGDGVVQYEEFFSWIMASSGELDHLRRVSREDFKSAQWVHMKEGNLTDFYEVGSELGSGGYGSVSTAVNRKTQKTRAIKTISKSKMTREHIDFEMDMMKEMDHPNITQLYEVYQDSVSYHLVMELLSGGELFDYIVEVDSVTEREVGHVMRQVFSVMKYMHSKRICHCDIKPENLMLKEKGPIIKCTIKVIDFGLSRKLAPGTLLQGTVGTPEYMAPEMFTSKEGYDSQVDSWACGVLLFILFTGTQPFAGDSDEETLEMTKVGLTCWEPVEAWDVISTEAKNLIAGLLAVDPQKRLTVDEALKHPWMLKLASREVPDVKFSSQHLAHMKAFCGQNKLKKAALHLIARRLSCDEIHHLREVFMSMDKDKDGMLSSAELKESIDAVGLKDIAEHLMHEIDDDWSGHINYTEFLAAAMEKKHYAEESVCWAAFHMFDRDSNGVIDRKELAQVLHNSDLEVCIGSETISRVIKDCDTNNDGVIDFPEFLAMMRRSTD